MTDLAPGEILSSPPKPRPASPAQEWRASKRWNPFNSYKLLAHVERWKNIRRGRPLPAPALITVDPTNTCNLDCAWCNAEYIRRERNFQLSEKVLVDVANFLPRWGRQAFPTFGLNAVCVAGGGEPLINAATPVFIDHVVRHGIEVGMVTNGGLISNAMDALSQCTWLGVSVDAGSNKTYNALKGLPENARYFDRVIENMARITDYARSRHARLGAAHPGNGVSYKYLMYKENIGEVFEAAKLAKEIGCRNIHFRPAGTTWDNIGTENEISFTPDEVALFNEQIALAAELDDDTFNVYGITHKFTQQFERNNDFSRCHAVFMTAVVSPPSKKESPKDSFVLSLCCDRRGDSKLELLTDEENVERIETAWGSRRHWDIHDRIRIVEECPRCTYQPHNQIYEQVILNDSMTYKFI